MTEVATNYLDIVEELKSYLSSGGAADMDFVLDTVGRYAEACQDVNDRLHDCDRLLRTGRITEAIQAAEREPNLLDAAALLDFPERPELEARLAAERRILPPPIDLACAARINAAYEQAGNLNRLLATHRLLALGRAPVTDRLQILRRLAAAAPENDGWQSDLVAYEAAAIKEIQRAISERNGALAEEQLRMVIDLLTAPDWKTPPTGELIEKTRTRLQSMEDERLLRDLAELVTNMEAARTACDVSTLSELAKQVGTFDRQWSLPAGQELRRCIEEPLRWLEDEQRKENQKRQNELDLADLRRGLEEMWPQRDLEPVYLRLMASHASVDQNLITMYRHREHAWRLQGRRRQQALIVGILFGLAIFGTAIYQVIQRSARSGELRDAREKMRQFVDAENWPSAREYYDALHKSTSYLVQDPEIKALAKKLQDVELAEEQRVNRFNELIARIEESGASRQDWDALREAEKLANTNSEKARVKDWERSFHRTQNQRRQERTASFQTELESFQRDVEAIAPGPSGLPAADLPYLDELDARAKELLKRYSDVESRYTEQLNVLQERIRSWKRALINASGWEKAKRTIGRDIEPARYSQHLQELVKLYPDAATELSTALRRSALWEGLDDVREFLTFADAHPLFRLSPQDARNWLDRFSKAQPQFDALSIEDPFRDHLEHIGDMAARDSPEMRQRFEKLNNLIQMPIFRESPFVARSTSGKTISVYYLKKNVKDDLWDYFINTEGKTKQRQFKADSFEVVENPLHLTISRIERFCKMPDRISRFEDAILVILDDLRKDHDMDPVLKTALIYRFLQDGCDGSQLLERNLGPAKRKMNGAIRDLDLQANWVLPDGEFAESARVSTRKFLGTFDQLLSTSIQRAKAARNAMQTVKVQPRPEYAGYLLREGEHLHFYRADAVKLPEQAELVAILPSGSKHKLQPIGAIQSGNVRLTSLAQTAAASGDRVYYRAKPSGGTN